MNLKKLVIASHELNSSGVCYILAYSSRSSRNYSVDSTFFYVQIAKTWSNGDAN